MYVCLCVCVLYRITCSKTSLFSEFVCLFTRLSNMTFRMAYVASWKWSPDVTSFSTESTLFPVVIHLAIAAVPMPLFSRIVCDQTNYLRYSGYVCIRELIGNVSLDTHTHTSGELFSGNWQKIEWLDGFMQISTANKALFVAYFTVAHISFDTQGKVQFLRNQLSTANKINLRI